MSVVGEMYLELLHGLSGVPSSCLYQTEITSEIVSPVEGELLNRVKEIGEKYCKLRAFITEVNEQELSGKSQGLYLSLFAEHLDQCLQPYLNAIISLEPEEPRFQTIYSKIYPYDELLTGLILVVDDVKRHSRKGVLVLQALHQNFQSSVRVVRIAIKFITRGVTKLFLKQLQLWLLHGELSDRRHEFFIKRKEETSMLRSTIKSFVIDCNLLPTFIRPRLAEKILDVGKTVLLLRSRPNTHRVEESKSGCSLDIDKTGIIGAKGEKIANQLQEVVKAEIWRQWELLEPIVDAVAAVATAQLHLHAMQDGNLMQQLQLVKDLFLMGRGELFHEFVVQTDRPIIEDYTLVLVKCARKVHIDEETLKPFTLEVVPNEGNPQFQIVYAVPWPLQLLFTEDVIASYNHIFRFLLRLKRIQVKMVASWLRSKDKRSGQRGGKCWELQQKLWFLVNNLQYYLQVDVLDSQFVALEKGIKESKDFEEIRLCHSKFLANLTTQSFLDLPQESTPNPVQQRIIIILSLCEAYSLQVEKSADGEPCSETVSALSNKFDASFEYLMALLLALKNKGAHPCSQHLAQLILRLDFNHFFSNKFGDNGLFGNAF